MAEPVREIRWRISELLFRLSYRICPDKDAYDYVLRHGILHTKDRIANRPTPTGGEPQ